MNTRQNIAKHFSNVFFGENWTSVNLKDTLADVSWQQATTKVHDLNTIAMLVFHINYYIDPVLKVLQGGALQASDQFSFGVPDIRCEEEWTALKNKVFTEAETFATAISGLDESKLFEDFHEGKYGNFYYNLHGIIEHCHYHLGQIVIIKKIIAGLSNDDKKPVTF